MFGVAVVFSISLVEFTSYPEAADVVLTFGKIFITLGLAIVAVQVLFFDRFTFDSDVGGFWWYLIVLFEIVLLFCFFTVLEIALQIHSHDIPHHVDPSLEDDLTCSSKAVLSSLFALLWTCGVIVLHHEESVELPMMPSFM
jgi:hypothetical protein